MATVWIVQNWSTLNSSLDKFAKKNRLGVKGALKNVDRFLDLMNKGHTLQNVGIFGFVHNENEGLFAVDQSPPSKGVMVLRLYIYPDTRTNTLWVLLLGKKDAQPRDLPQCREIVDAIKAQ